jgi:hypothetical protein
MNADPALKPLTQKILGVLVMKKGNEVEVDGEKVVRVKASYPEIAEWTGHHKDTVADHMRRADRAGWVEVTAPGDGSGRKNTYLLTYPAADLVGQVTHPSSVTRPTPRRSSDLPLVGQKNTNQQVEASQDAQVPQVLKGTEGTRIASRTRVTRAPRAATPNQKDTTKPGDPDQPYCDVHMPKGDEECPDCRNRQIEHRARLREACTECDDYGVRLNDPQHRWCKHLGAA